MKVAFHNFLWVKSHLNLSTKKSCQKTVKGQFHVKKIGAKTLIFRQRKLLIGKSLIKYPFNAQRAVNLSLDIPFNFKLLHRRPTNCFLKKVDFKTTRSALFVIRKRKTWYTYFEDAKKQTIFGIVFLSGCSLSLGEHNYLHRNTALGLRPDSSKHKLQINFCCLIAKHHIWLCRSKEHPPNLNNFLLYLKHIYQIENNASTVKNKWEPLLPFISLLTWVSKTFSVLFGFDCALLPKIKKKGNGRAVREKGKNGQDVLTSLFAFSLLLSSQLMLCMCVFLLLLLLFSFFVTFYLYLICCCCCCC